MILNVLTYPDPILRQVCEPILAFDAELEALIQSMFETMHHYQGIGLAASQVGILKRLLVLEYESQKMALINPEIVSLKGKAIAEEGCLSLPGVGVRVERGTHIVVKAFSRKGNAITVRVRGMVARIIQHELDHLDGKLIIDHGSPITQENSTPDTKEMHP
jgi:peptide deformylase